MAFSHALAQASRPERPLLPTRDAKDPAAKVGRADVPELAPAAPDGPDPAADGTVVNGKAGGQEMVGVEMQMNEKLTGRF